MASYDLPACHFHCFTWVGLLADVINQTNAVIAVKAGGHTYRMTGQLVGPTPQIHKHTKKESRRKRIRASRRHTACKSVGVGDAA